MGKDGDGDVDVEDEMRGYWGCLLRDGFHVKLVYSIAVVGLLLLLLFWKVRGYLGGVI